MLDNGKVPPDREIPSGSRRARDEEHRRNALTWHRLELIREYKRLRAELSEVWDEAGGD